MVIVYKKLLFIIVLLVSITKPKSILDRLVEEIELYVWKVFHTGDNPLDFIDILDDRIFQICSDKLGKLDKKRITSAFSYCGKGLSELGNEKECTNLAKPQNATFDGYEYDLTYFQLIYNLNYEDVNDDEDRIVAKFIDQKTYYTGFCMVSDCMPLLKKIFTKKDNNNSTNQSYYRIVEDYLVGFGVEGTTIREPRKSENQYGYNLFIKIAFAYLLMKLLASLIRMIFISEGYERAHLQAQFKQIEQDKARGNLESKDNTFTTNCNINEEKKSTFIFTKASKIEEENDFESGRDYSRYSIYLRTIKFLDIFDNLSQMSNLEGSYYNERGMEIIVLIRVILMFFITLNQNVYTLNEIPGRDFLNIGFYKSFSFCFIKLSTYAVHCWIMIDGLVFAYKLMSYIKKQLQKELIYSIKFIWFVKFIGFSIPKLILFLICFYAFGIYSDKISTIFQEAAIFEFYKEDILKDIECISHPYKIYIPFMIPYWKNITSKDVEDNYYYNNCFKFVNISLNEFYCFIFLLLIVYISYKIKSKIFDYAYIGIIIINSGLLYFSIKWSSELNKSYTLKKVLGHKIGEKLTHLFLNTYSFGFLLGMCYFYYNDSVSHNSLTHFTTFNPFSFCFDIVKFLDELKFKKIIFWLIFFIFFIFSSSFKFFLFNHSDETLLISFEKAPEIVFLFYYEKVMFSIIFIFFMVFILVYPRNYNNTDNIMPIKLLLPFTRTSTAFICLNDTLIYIGYCIFNLQVKLTYLNLIFLTFGIIVIECFFCFCITLMFEFPFRVFIKHFLRVREGNNEVEQRSFKDSFRKFDTESGFQ